MTKLEQILQDKNVKRWYDNVRRGAVTTADVYGRRLRAFCGWAGKDPTQLAQMDVGDLYQLILDFVTEQEEQGKAGSYIESTVKSVKSWLSFNQKFIQGRIKIRGARKAPSLSNERVPTQDELRRIFLASTIRDRVACVLVAHSGLRLETLGSYLGNDGLRVGDLPEMEISDGEVTFTKIPTMVVVRDELSKARHQYFSFLSEEGTNYLKQYLELRMNNGEMLDPDSDIISPKWADKKFVRTINIGDMIRKSMKAADFKGRPYVLRSFFDTQLLLSESKGRMARDYRVFMMGHVGGIESKYTTHKGTLNEQMIEDMRDSYRKSMVYLQTIHTEDEENQKTEISKYILRATGVSQEEMDQIDIDNMTEEDVLGYLRKKLQNSLKENGNRQKVIPLVSVEDYIQNGWEYVNNLPDDRAIVRLPFE